jgi:hypothetical protein
MNGIVGMDEWNSQHEAPITQEFLMPNEPPLASVLRARLRDRRVCAVHLSDGSQIMGQIGDVADDGCSAVIVNGRDEYVFDVSQVAVVQTPRREE